MIKALASLGSPAWAATNALARAFLSRNARRLPCPVIAVGNIVAGGVGKTELTAVIARRLLEQGRRVTVASRGYGSTWSARGGAAQDAASALALNFPDESIVILKKAPGTSVTVGADRFKVLTRHWEELCPDVVLLDDGLQHFQLYRDLDVVVHDFSVRWPILRDWPRVMLKAKVKVSLSAVPERAKAGTPWVRASYVLIGTVDAMGQSKPLPREALVFCGIANPGRLARSLEHAGVGVLDVKYFEDHALYDHFRVKGLLEWKKRKEESLGRRLPLLTTLKDYVKLGSFIESQGGMAGFEPQWLDLKLDLVENSDLLWKAIDEALAIGSS